MYGIHRPGSQNKTLGSEILEASFLLTLLPAFAESRAKRLLPIEIRAARNVRVSDARALDAFCAEFPRRAACGLPSTTVATSRGSRKPPSPRRWGACSERR